MHNLARTMKNSSELQTPRGCLPGEVTSSYEKDSNLTEREAALYLKSSCSTLSKRRLTGDGPPFFKIGRAIRYRRIDLDAWIRGTISTRSEVRPQSKKSSQSPV